MGSPFKRPDDRQVQEEIKTLEWQIKNREVQITSLIREGNPEALAALMPSLSILQGQDLGRLGGIKWMMGLSDVGPAIPRYSRAPNWGI